MRSTNVPTSWIGWKERGHRLYAEGEYGGALQSFLKCVDDPIYECPVTEHHLLLSNVVACRLKLGGTEQVELAIRDAKRCVALKSTWAKAHVRLATAYIQHGQQSNLACQSLQTALRHDPSHPTARQMLIRELARDRHQSSMNTGTDSHHTRPGTGTHTSSSTRTNQDMHGDDGLEDPDFLSGDNRRSNTATWYHLFRGIIQRGRTGYRNLSEDQQALLKLVVGLLILYIAFGGRFGLSGSHPRHRKIPSPPSWKGNYDRDNVYNAYRDSNKKKSSLFTEDYFASGSRRSQNHDHYSRQSWLSTLDGESILVASLVLGVVYVMHVNGFSIWEILLAVNMLQGRGHRRGMRFGGGGIGGGRRRRRAPFAQHHGWW